MKLKLNEEQQGLKLIQVNDGFVVVDVFQKSILDNTLVYDWHNKIIRNSEVEYGTSWKILFATPNLNLEDVPEIEENENNLGLDYVLKLPNAEYLSFEIQKMLEIAVLYGYKQAQQNLFTEDDMLDFIMYYIQTVPLSFDSTQENHELTKEELLDKWKSLKQPKIEITFENDKPIKCVML